MPVFTLNRKMLGRVTADSPVMDSEGSTSSSPASSGPMWKAGPLPSPVFSVSSTGTHSSKTSAGSSSVKTGGIGNKLKARVSAISQKISQMRTKSSKAVAVDAAVEPEVVARVENVAQTGILLATRFCDILDMPTVDEDILDCMDMLVHVFSFADALSISALALSSMEKLGKMPQMAGQDQMAVQAVAELYLATCFLQDEPLPISCWFQQCSETRFATQLEFAQTTSVLLKVHNYHIDCNSMRVTLWRDLLTKACSSSVSRVRSFTYKLFPENEPALSLCSFERDTEASDSGCEWDDTESCMSEGTP